MTSALRERGPSETSLIKMRQSSRWFANASSLVVYKISKLNLLQFIFNISSSLLSTQIAHLVCSSFRSLRSPSSNEHTLLVAGFCLSKMSCCFVCSSKGNAFEMFRTSKFSTVQNRSEAIGDFLTLKKKSNNRLNASTAFIHTGDLIFYLKQNISILKFY